MSNVAMEMDEARSAWTDLLGGDRVLVAAEAQRVYGSCTTAAQRRLAGALRPKDVASIASILRIATRHRVAVYPISTGRNWGYGTALPVRDDCVIVDLSDLREVRAFDPETGIVTIEPGVTQGMLAEFLDRGGHSFLVPVHGGGPDCSVVGNAIERGYGITPNADHFGAVLALEAVLADGSVYRSPLPELTGAAGSPGFKWGIGPYLDGLFTQSGLGVVTSMTIALAARPECIKAVVFGLPEDRLAAGVVAVREALRRLPGIVGGLNLMNAHRVLSMAVPYPRDRLGPDGVIAPEVIAQLARAHHVHAWTGFGALYGPARVVRAAQRELASVLRPHVRELTFVGLSTIRRVNRVRRLLGLELGSFGRRLDVLESGLELVEGRPNRTALPLSYWRSGTLPPESRPMDPARDGCGLIWYAPLVPMTSEHVRRYVAFVTERTRAYRLEPLITLTSTSDRCFDSTVPLLFDRSNPEETARARQCARELLEAGRLEGFVPYRVGIDSMPWLHASTPAHADLVRRLKAALDPEAVLSPGRYTS